MTTDVLDERCLCGHERKVHGQGWGVCYGAHSCRCRRFVQEEEKHDDSSR